MSVRDLFVSPIVPCVRFSVTNKLAPSNLEKLVQKIKALKITQKETLELITQILFDKAVSESTRAGVYAQVRTDFVIHNSCVKFGVFHKNDAGMM